MRLTDHRGQLYPWVAALLDLAIVFWGRPHQKP